MEGGQDASGLQYRRNRYYDPKTGRFTQEDPIGLGGGLNAYGFANGDPVNFSDPFGLGPCKNYPQGHCPDWLQRAERASDALAGVGIALAGIVSAVSDFVTNGAAGHLWSAGSGISEDGKTLGNGDRLLLAGLAMAEMVPGENVIFTGKKVTNALARTLNLERRDLGRRIESIKKGARMRPNQNVKITSLGNVFRKDTGELIGNVFDELRSK